MLDFVGVQVMKWRGFALFEWRKSVVAFCIWPYFRLHKIKQSETFFDLPLLGMAAKTEAGFCPCQEDCNFFCKQVSVALLSSWLCFDDFLLNLHIQEHKAVAFVKLIANKLQLLKLSIASFAKLAQRCTSIGQ